MKVTFGVNNQPSSVFKDMPNPVQNFYMMPVNKNKSDTFEKHSIKEAIKNNKKLIIGVSILGAAAIGAVVFRRNITSLIKPTKSSVETVNSEIMQPSLTQEMINNAKDFLIKNVKETGEAAANGICFYGPDSLGKEKAISSFLGDLKNAGYKVEYAPRIKDTPIEEIAGSIDKLIGQAEERFKTTNTRTAIVVRDLDKIAFDRCKENGASTRVVSALLKTQECRKRGFAWISEAFDVSNLDIAVARTGRMEHKIPIMPFADEPVSLWKQYIALIEKFKDGTKKDTLLRTAKEIISKKGI